MRILIVDDNVMSLDILAASLEASGHEVERATDGHEGLDRILEGDIRLVISDWEMPGMTGEELCQAVRSAGLPAYVYFILLTSHADSEHIVRGLAAGADDFVSKPFNPDELTVRVRAGERVLALETRDLAMFAMAKDMRKKKRTDLAKQYISHGKGILEEALKNYPNTTLVAQGEYLVATLAQELGNYNEAVGKYSEVVQRWTKSSYAPKALYRIGQCYEAQGNFERASEEYVRVTYLFPNSPEVPQATLRLGRHYLKTEKYAVAGRIFEKFHDNNPKHRLASKTLFLSGECYRLSERYKEAIGVFKRAGKLYADNKQIRSESLYWHGVCARELKDYVNAYRTLKRLTWDYPESQRAADARKLLGTDELQTYAPEEPEDE